MRDFFNLLQIATIAILYQFIPGGSCGRSTVALAILAVGVPAYLVGRLAAWLCRERFAQDSVVLDIAAWSNLVFWIFPPLGFAAFGFSDQLVLSHERKKLLVYILAYAGFLITILTAGMESIELAQAKGIVACAAAS